MESLDVIIEMVKSIGLILVALPWWIDRFMQVIGKGKRFIDRLRERPPKPPRGRHLRK